MIIPTDLDAYQAIATLQGYILSSVMHRSNGVAGEHHHTGHKYHLAVQDWEANYDKLEQLVAIQTSEGNAVDAYMVGMANGLLLARHAMIGATGDVGYLDVPVTASKSNREDALNRQIMQLMRDNRALAEERNNACAERDKAINNAFGEREDRVELLINERDAARKEVHYLRTQRDAAMEAYTELHLTVVPPPVLWPSNVEPPTEAPISGKPQLDNPMDKRWQYGYTDSSPSELRAVITMLQGKVHAMQPLNFTYDADRGVVRTGDDDATRAPKYRTDTAPLENWMDPRWAAAPRIEKYDVNDDRTMPQMAFVIGKLQHEVRAVRADFVSVHNTIAEKYNEGVRDGQTEARQELAMMASETDYKLIDILKRKKVHLRVRNGEEHGARLVTLKPEYISRSADGTNLALVGTQLSGTFVAYTSAKIVSWTVDAPASEA